MTEKNVVTWYIPGQVIYIGWATNVTIEDIGAVSDQVTALLDTVDTPVCVLSDARRTRQQTQHPLQIRHAMTFLDHPQLQSLTSVTCNAVVRFLATVVPQMLSFTESKVYGRMDEALAHLKVINANRPLDWAQADESVLVKPVEAATPAMQIRA